MGCTKSVHALELDPAPTAQSPPLSAVFRRPSSGLMQVLQLSVGISDLPLVPFSWFCGFSLSGLDPFVHITACPLFYLLRYFSIERHNSSKIDHKAEVCHKSRVYYVHFLSELNVFYYSGTTIEPKLCKDSILFLHFCLFPNVWWLKLYNV